MKAKHISHQFTANKSLGKEQTESIIFLLALCGYLALISEYAKSLYLY
jgi:hypothetical protein